jgi:hypothetical protein
LSFRIISHTHTQTQNLPETIRESDVAKLSFAADLASGFYNQWKGGNGNNGGGKKKGGSSNTSPAGHMLWVIQRDFLQGKGVQQLVDEALAPVPNPKQDKELAQLNRVRESLAAIAGQSTGERLRGGGGGSATSPCLCLILK